MAVKLDNLKNILKFLQKAEELKSLMRHSWLSTGRRESVAEHSWRTALLAIILAPEMKGEINLGRVVQMIVVHDIAEIIAGDHPAWRGKLKDKAKKERSALKGLSSDLPPKQQKEILALWEEYEAKTTPEGKFAKAVDKLETIDQHNLADIKTWNKHEKTYNLIHGQKESEYSQTLRDFKALIDLESQIKIKKN